MTVFPIDCENQEARSGSLFYPQCLVQLREDTQHIVVECMNRNSINNTSVKFTGRRDPVPVWSEELGNPQILRLLRPPFTDERAWLATSDCNEWSAVQISLPKNRGVFSM